MTEGVGLNMGLSSGLISTPEFREDHLSEIDIDIRTRDVLVLSKSPDELQRRSYCNSLPRGPRCVRAQDASHFDADHHTDGGVLLLLAKGIPRGMHLVAAARNSILQSRIYSSVLEVTQRQVEPSDAHGDQPCTERGKIIAPWTNHADCATYKPQGMVKGRRDILPLFSALRLT